MTIAPLDNNAPDWSAITDTIRCPLCEYDLRGLSESRCPECGYKFDWPALLDADRRVPVRGFEHAKHQYFRAFFFTAVASWIPWQFWREIQPQHPIRVSRLIAYSLLCALLYFVAALLLLSVALIREPLQKTGHIVDAMYQLPAQLAAVAENILLPIGFIGALYLAWPWMTYATLRVFVQSMRRARIKPTHVLRCALYSVDAGIFLGLLTTSIALWRGGDTRDFMIRPLNLNFDARSGFLLRITIFVAVLTTWRLTWAYRMYMKFDHPIATAIASQAIVCFAALAAILWTML